LIEYGVKREKISVVYDGVENTELLPSIDRDQVRGNLGMDKEALVLGCIGHFTAEKGHADLIKAFAQIHEGHPNAKLLLVGDGPLKDQYRHLIHKLNLGQRVILAGIASDLREFLAAMDIFVFPSVSEGLGSVLLMAMANRLPVAASRVGGIPEIVIDGQTGFLFPPGDSISLAKCVLHAIDDRFRLRHCAEKAAERVREHFSITRMVEETYRIYSNVLSR
jgi:L-malate glycosyltransferase